MLSEELWVVTERKPMKSTIRSVFQALLFVAAALFVVHNTTFQIATAAPPSAVEMLKADAVWKLEEAKFIESRASSAEQEFRRVEPLKQRAFEQARLAQRVEIELKLMAKTPVVPMAATNATPPHSVRLLPAATKRLDGEQLAAVRQLITATDKDHDGKVSMTERRVISPKMWASLKDRGVYPVHIP